MADLVNLLHLERFGSDKNLIISELLVEREYSSETLNYIENYQRNLSNWDENDLLWRSEKNKRRKFCFVELIWIAIIKELRNFGFSLVLIKNVKDQILKPTPIENVIERLNKHDPQLEAFIEQFAHLNKYQLKELIQEMITKQSELQVLNTSFLSGLIAFCMYHRRMIYLLINSKAEVVPFIAGEKNLSRENPIIKSFIDSTHISICINTLLGYFLPQEYMNFKLKGLAFSENEIKVLDLMRNPNVASVLVKFDSKNEIDLIETTERKKGFLEQRLSEIILNDGYQEITVKAKDGKILDLIKRRKHTIKK